MAGANLTADVVRFLLNYDPDTGVFRRKHGGRGGAMNSIAGCINLDGYRVIRCQNTLFLAHRLAWLHFYGNWPLYQIDHINSIRSDNRIANLRDVEQHINMQNRKYSDRDSRLRILGVTMSRGLYKAQIKINGKNTFIGRFKTAKEAHAAYIAVKRFHHEGNTL